MQYHKTSCHIIHKVLVTVSHCVTKRTAMQTDGTVEIVVQIPYYVKGQVHDPYIYSVCILVCIKKRQYEWKDLNERQQIDKIQSLLLFIVKEIFVTSHYLGGGGHLFLRIRWLKIDHMINSNFIFFFIFHLLVHVA